MNKSTKEYAKELVSQMTLEEKNSQMVYTSPAIERLGIPAYNWWNESLHGVARAGQATMFPQVIGLAATFDRELIHDIADVISTEGRAKFNQFSRKEDRGIYKGLTFWAPNINIFRDPRWGRGHETFGEDPYLTAELGISYIKGIQGEDPEHLKAAACAKHYAVHSGPESLRHEFNAEVSRQDLYGTYLYAFKRCVKEAQVEAVMGAYNRVNGAPACGSKELLQDILRDEWGFEGHVVSDCWAIKDFHENHHVTNNMLESVAMAVNNGCDLNCGNAYLYLDAACKEQMISEEVITAAVERLIEVRIRLGMLPEYKSPYEDIPYSKVECREHIDLSLEAARRSAVLLKNENQILPLDKNQIKTIGVIGPNADSREALVGNYTGTSSQYITIADGIRQAAGEGIQVLTVEGCHLFKDRTEFLAEPKDRFAEALIVAEQSDVVVLCLGMDATIEGEQGDAGNEYAGGDKMSLKLPGLQQELMETVAGTGKPVILVLMAGSAMDLSWAQEHVPGILDVWYPGARGGQAVAELLFGAYSPCGKLPVTFYKNTEKLPEFTDYSMRNRTYRYANDNILYPFGYGLTYSSVEYSDTSVSKDVLAVDEDLQVSAVVRNTGAYAIREVVEVYLKKSEAGAMDPGFQLKGMENISLEPGESKTVTITVKASEFALADTEGSYVVNPGEYQISIGGHQPDSLSEQLTGVSVSILQVNKIGNSLVIE